MNIKSLVHLLLVLVGLFAGCAKENNDKDTRSFFLGTTPWPGDFTISEVDRAYDFINDHCDIVSHHFDDGIPYDEFYFDKPLPAAFLQEIQTRKTKSGSTLKTFLSVAPLNLSRKMKADYFKGSSADESTKSEWTSLPIHNDKVVAAYTKYICYLIEELNPVYVNYAVESNLYSWPAADFNNYKQFLSKVYAALKTKYPAIPFFVSFMVDETPDGFMNASQLLPYSDWIALSSYPYTSVSSSANGNTDPADFPADYYERYINLDLSKPFAFVETGYIAEDLVIPAFNLNKKGTAKWQADYLEKVLQLSEKYKAKLFIWFCSKDFDAGNNTLRSMNLYQDLFGFWEDTGFIDENNRARDSYQVWLKWKRKTKR